MVGDSGGVAASWGAVHIDWVRGGCCLRLPFCEGAATG